MASQAEVSKIFSNIGFEPLSIQTSYANGCSHYVTVKANVLNEGKCYIDMYVDENKEAYITIRVSDHPSGLELNCGGVSGNKMTFGAFEKLINTGAISAK